MKILKMVIKFREGPHFQGGDAINLNSKYRMQRDFGISENLCIKNKVGSQSQQRQMHVEIFGRQTA